MAITQAYTNSQTVSGTEFSMPNDANYSSGSPMTASGVYQCFVDLSAMAAGDEFELTVYEKISGSGSTQRVVYKKNFFGSCALPIQVTPSLVLINGWDITLKKIAGTDRSIEWSIRKVG